MQEEELGRPEACQFNCQDASLAAIAALSREING